MNVVVMTGFSPRMGQKGTEKIYLGYQSLEDCAKRVGWELTKKISPETGETIYFSCGNRVFAKDIAECSVDELEQIMEYSHYPEKEDIPAMTYACEALGRKKVLDISCGEEGVFITYNLVLHMRLDWKLFHRCNHLYRVEDLLSDMGFDEMSIDFIVERMREAGLLPEHMFTEVSEWEHPRFLTSPVDSEEYYKGLFEKAKKNGKDHYFFCFRRGRIGKHKSAETEELIENVHSFRELLERDKDILTCVTKAEDGTPLPDDQCYIVDGFGRRVLEGRKAMDSPNVGELVYDKDFDCESVKHYKDCSSYECSLLVNAYEKGYYLCDEVLRHVLKVINRRRALSIEADNESADIQCDDDVIHIERDDLFNCDFGYRHEVYEHLEGMGFINESIFAVIDELEQEGWIWKYEDED